MNSKGRDREGYVAGGIQRPRASGFTDDIKTSNLLDNVRDERITPYHLDPYQIRFIYSFDFLFNCLYIFFLEVNKHVIHVLFIQNTTIKYIYKSQWNYINKINYFLVFDFKKTYNMKCFFSFLFMAMNAFEYLIVLIE